MAKTNTIMDTGTEEEGMVADNETMNVPKEMRALPTATNAKIMETMSGKTVQITRGARTTKVKSPEEATEGKKTYTPKRITTAMMTMMSRYD